MAEISGGEVIARMLQKEGVEKVFGIIDGTYFGFYSALHRLGIEIVTPRHETSAAHMAGAYARLTGKLGVCMASNGPGVANLLPGLVVEQGEGNRVLAITSARRPGIMYPDRGGAYQCFDQSGVIGRIAKWSAAASSFERVPELVRKALRKSWEGRPGVVHVDVPENIMNGKVKADVAFWAPQQYRTLDPLEPNAAQVARAAELLAAAQAPMIHVGSGVVHAGAYAALARVAELLQAPVTTSWAARGALPETSPLAMPMPHVKVNHKVRNDADVALIVGSRLGETDWWGKPPYWRTPSEQKTIQVDLDPDVLGLNKPADLAIQADAKRFLELLGEVLEKHRNETGLDARRARNAGYAKMMAEDRAGWDKALSDMAIPMHPAHIATVCGEVFPKDAVLVADGGNATIWAMFYHRADVPNRIVSTFKFGMLGAGMAQAVGAAVALPGRPVCCIIGDGAFGFHPQEVETAVRNQAQVIYIVLCDKQWGMVKMNQQFMLRPFKTLLFKHLDPEETIKADLGEIAFDKLGESMGAHGERVSDPRELKPALQRAIQSGRCAVVHVDVDPVKHMWAPGLMHFKKMHEEPKG
ncbi:MAG: thiamine pyrophosphate-binding protein [Burkholderiales bacterium]|jgi:acetolactate synthase-1/2/3 large subunit|uniref:Thiamine pyrophosphate-binding protein n=1 Tax=Candidatus Desulfobacillus denitrificans TaxID=2608985 RepID=A0A809R346_9PROT|nr:Acetolactate synthase isozyme 3 large subunit [Rhodocyclaceae bacterium]MCZ2173779.1 thiamine pyrophosphate-binding protein [Burkholderiales bacterium]OQY66455.1 MAG: thiamine pyrophosphate-binding protein [Rhodocyclaceae bacterium UTPRO2]BBO21148.1 thiamine pyrophosphate-binding protein [Candidatus Desulfobacillus denitrificans]GIK45798.1 MAG: acetolactate synthase large subunit [Betaproteobacteria bacterium]